MCECTDSLVFIDFPGKRSLMHHLPLGQVQILHDKNQLLINNLMIPITRYWLVVYNIIDYNILDVHLQLLFNLIHKSNTLCWALHVEIIQYRNSFLTFSSRIMGFSLVLRDERSNLLWYSSSLCWERTQLVKCFHLTLANYFLIFADQCLIYILQWFCTSLFSASLTAWLTWLRIFLQHSPAFFTFSRSSPSSVRR